ncbi:hypothetical protein DPMN_098466 [Dreissena polymorpha]|uniref:Uncharacterized protein n=1 Tax=Dreissena polymorpha TaxID=45954 RepID=A0A9D4LC56_DREPO|nr:hypothetical protein DPMN_098466 [Dreissena polymorpha]
MRAELDWHSVRNGPFCEFGSIFRWFWFWNGKHVGDIGSGPGVPCCSRGIGGWNCCLQQTTGKQNSAKYSRFFC